MVRRHGSPRRSSSRRRRSRFKTGYSYTVVPRLYKVQKEEMVEGVRQWLQNQDELERQVMADLEPKTVD